MNDNIFTLPPIGRMGARKIDRIFIDKVNYRAKELRRATKISRFSPSNEDGKEENGKQLKLDFGGE